MTLNNTLDLLCSSEIEFMLLESQNQELKYRLGEYTESLEHHRTYIDLLQVTMDSYKDALKERRDEVHDKNKIIGLPAEL